MIKLIRKFKKKKYSHCYFNQRQIITYLNILNKISNDKKINKCKLNINNLAPVEEFILKIYKQNKISKNDQKFLIILFKKFSINLNLKKEYSKKFIKKTDTNCRLLFYLIFGVVIFKHDIKISVLNKLNSILKIIDLGLIKKNKTKLENFFLTLNTNILIENLKKNE